MLPDASPLITAFLAALDLRDATRGERNLQSLQKLLGEERLQRWLPLWQSLLARSADADMALNNLERYFSAEGALDQLEALLVDHPHAIETLVSLFGTSQFLSDTLVMQPSAIRMLGLPLRHTPTLAELIAELQGEIDGCFEDSSVLRAIRHYRARHLLRIGINDIIRDRPLEEVTADIADVAQAAVHVALATAERTVQRRFGEPVTADGQPGHLVVLAFGKLGGRELNYSSDIDLMMVYNEDGQTTGKLVVTHEEYCSRVTTEMLRLLTVAPAAYRVDFRLRPEGQRGPLVRSLASTLAYYDTLGRTWERQALIKVRPLAGHLPLGQQFLQAIEPFVYRQYLSLAEISEIKAIKRKIEQRALKQGDDTRDVKTGYGGIRDVEFVIQFLQLLNGGELPLVRSNNTLTAITALLRADCLTPTEGEILETGYRFLRRTEHRLQLLSDLQTHHLPQRDEELRRLALRLGYHDSIFPAQEQFEDDFKQATSFNRKVLNHLLHDAFAQPTHTDTPESDLILLPENEIDKPELILQKYGFKDPVTALNNLQLLAQEPVPFLPTRRCRHFLASIAPRLLQALGETPDPDMALTNLEKVTASLGAKGVLWELFSINEPSLKLYVDLCSSSQYLSQILMSHPGMIDELVDSLVLDQPKSLDDLRSELAELCRGADPQLIDRILHSFQNKELLRIGVQDILGKRPLRETLASLSALAEVILSFIVEREYQLLCQRWGEPGTSTGEQCRYAVVGLGKLGGREMSYQSDLDLILIYEDDGQTQSTSGESTNNFHFFSELAQRMIKALGQLSSLGRLYHVDMRLRPTGKSGSLVVPLEGFRKYYGEGSAQLWERQALTRGRVVVGETAFGQRVMDVIHEAAYGPTWTPAMAEEILAMRKRMEAASKGENDLKRGVGGIVDVEFLVQLHLLKHGRVHPEVVHSNIWDALAALWHVGLMEEQHYRQVLEHYEFLRTVESRQRIVHQQSMDTLPGKKEDLLKLVRRLGYEVSTPSSAVDQFLIELTQRTLSMRALFMEIIERERAGTA